MLTKQQKRNRKAKGKKKNINVQRSQARYVNSPKRIKEEQK